MKASTASSQRYVYKFVRCAVSAGSQGVATESYRKVIEQHAEDGWRLVQILVQIPAAVPSEYELIFEQPMED